MELTSYNTSPGQVHFCRAFEVVHHHRENPVATVIALYPPISGVPADVYCKGYEYKSAASRTNRSATPPSCCVGIVRYLYISRRKVRAYPMCVSQHRLCIVSFVAYFVPGACMTTSTSFDGQQPVRGAFISAFKL